VELLETVISPPKRMESFPFDVDKIWIALDQIMDWITDQITDWITDRITDWITEKKKTRFKGKKIQKKIKSFIR